MARSITPERQFLKEWALCLKGCGMTQAEIGERLGLDRNSFKDWLIKNKNTNGTFILDKLGRLVHNSGLIVVNIKAGLPPNPKPQLFVGKAEDLSFLPESSVDIIITSPPYNLGQEKWPMGGKGRTPRNTGIVYPGHDDDMQEPEYQAWQIACLKALYRVAKPGASLFYNHKVRQHSGGLIHPISWLQGTSRWFLRQEIIWDRLSTHNHTPTLFWHQDERIYWLTKGKPNLPDKSIGLPSVWREFGPIPNTNHPAPFTPALPRMLLKAIGKPGDVVLDPFGGSMTTCLVASSLGYKSIGVDKSEAYVAQAAKYFGVDRGQPKIQT